VRSSRTKSDATKQLCNAFDLTRIHKFGHLDKNGDTGTKAQSYKAMCEWAKEIPEVKAFSSSNQYWAMCFLI
jgi:hypothetical protein